MQSIEQHNREKFERLEARKRELMGELLDIESYMNDLGVKSESIIYLGVHTDERFPDGTPKFKRECVFRTNLPYAQAIKLLRGLSDVAKRLLDFNIKENPTLLEFLDQMREGV